MMALLKRWRWALLVAALLLAGVIFAFMPEATPVDMAKVSRGPLSVGVTDDGVTRAEEYYVVSAPVTGYLSRIELEPGDAISKGSLITRMTGRPSSPLDPRTQKELQAALSAATAAEAGTKSSLEQARRDLDRAEELAKKGFLATSRLEAARTQVTTGQASYLQARAEAVRIRALLANSGSTPSTGAVAVRAPASGSVLSVINESEGVIAEGTPIMTIGDADEIEVVADLLSREAVRVKPGDRVEITQWGGPKPIPAHVKLVEPFGFLKVSALGIEEQRVNVIIGFDEAAAGQIARLGHGYQVDATIVLWSQKDALRVPIGALFRGRQGDWQVFVAGGNRARLRTVELGQINDEYAQVTKGLDEGEIVIVNPARSLEDKGRISER